MFWVQNQNDAFISMTDGNMIILNIDADIEELKEFCDMLSPACVFSDYDTLTSIGRKPKERINIMYRMADVKSEVSSDILRSDEIYSLLDVEGLSLPEYPYFAVDYCHRINMCTANYFALKDKCAAITFKCEDKAIINGIAAKEKGYGSVALKGILDLNYGRHFLVCCRDKVKGFYEKNGFEVAVTDLATDKSIYDIDYSKKAIVIGNEANGVSDEVKNKADLASKIATGITTATSATGVI